jgi:4-aminobutyrate aminotransferase-like enzyme
MSLNSNELKRKGIDVVRFTWIGLDGFVRFKGAHIDHLEKMAKSGIVLTKAMFSFTSMDYISPYGSFGLGLFWGVELIKDDKMTPVGTYEDKYNGKPTTVDKITSYMMERGVYIFGGASWLVISPPLIINKEEIDKGLNVLDDALQISDQEFHENRSK